MIDGGAFVGEWSAGIIRRHQCTSRGLRAGPAVLRHVQTPLEWLPGRRPVPPWRWAGRTVRRRSPWRVRVRPCFIRGGAPSTVDVEVRDVTAVLDGLGRDRLDLVKLNIEGGEYDVLERIVETGWLPRIDELLIQFHERYPSSHRRRRRIRRALARSHVEVWNYPWVWERWVRRTTSSTAAPDASPVDARCRYTVHWPTRRPRRRVGRRSGDRRPVPPCSRRGPPRGHPVPGSRRSASTCRCRRGT